MQLDPAAPGEEYTVYLRYQQRLIAEMMAIPARYLEEGMYSSTANQIRYRDMEQRTWPYGTKKNVVVADIIFPKNNKYAIILCEETPEVVHAILFLSHSLHDVKKGDKGVITFKLGGPTGGYWDYEAAE